MNKPAIHTVVERRSITEFQGRPIYNLTVRNTVTRVGSCQASRASFSDAIRKGSEWHYRQRARA